ncbi:DUF1294 domain-containing protein [Aestuariirhabdus sp. LZHN29]|uniref:DUF1294 domain-containing protein n=1 Tax=Aestuariirhabdus sp. LZHN29 TaxID=3417462 RepID=UPI003CF4214B
MKKNGTLSRWNDDRGFGFISPAQDAHNGEIFVHIKSFIGSRRRPEVGDRLQFRAELTPDGKQRAVEVLFQGEKARPKRSQPTRRPGALMDTSIATLFLGILVTLTLRGMIPPHLLMLYLGTSLGAFALYWKDKSAARNGVWRTSETTLWFAGLIGGWPGALIAQRVLRHKSSKASFQTIFWITVVINMGALGWVFTAEGAAKLQQVVAVIDRLGSRLLVLL